MLFEAGGCRSRYASSPVDLAPHFRGGAGRQGRASKPLLLSARLQPRCWCGASNVAIHGDALSGVNRCSSGNVDFQTSLLHPEPQPAPGPKPRREEGGKTPSTPSRPEPGGHAALRYPEAAEPGLGVPRRALTAPRCSEGLGWGVLRLPGALRSSLDPAKSPRDGCGQLINSK